MLSAQKEAQELCEALEEGLLTLSEYTILPQHESTLARMDLAIQDYKDGVERRRRSMEAPPRATP